MDIVERATQLAVRAHKEQVRKSDGTPYVAHPLSVARMLDKAGFDDTVVAAAIVHDVLEDTPVTETELREVLGDVVCEIVCSVSEDKELSWEERKEAYVEHIVAGSEGVWAVSVGDKIHNLKSLIDAYEEQGAAVWKKFNRGKEKKIWFERLLLTSLQAVWNHPLLDEYERLLTIVDSFDD
jgi:(p)ppGpp synthase/HD superfamily hydrolase